MPTLREIIDSVLEPKPAVDPTELNCKNCFWSEYTGKFCKQNGTRKDLVRGNEAPLCDNYTTSDPTTDAATTAAVAEVEGKTDVVAAAVGVTNGKLDTANSTLTGNASKLSDLKASTDLVKTAVDESKTEIGGVQVAVAAVESKTSDVKTAVDAVTSAVGAVQTQTEAVTAAVDDVQSKTADVETAVTAVYEKTLDVEAAVDNVRAMVARPAWYDRNPANRFLSYFDNLAPHSQTLRFSYTVPAGKKAFMECAVASLVQRSAPSIASHRTLFIAINYASGGCSLLHLHAENESMPSFRQNVGQAVTLLEGDTLTCYTVDGSAGGEVTYYASAKLTEFDA